MLRTLTLAALLLPVAACNRPDAGSSVSISADGGNVLGAIDGKTGEMKIDVPGFQGSVKLPKIQFDAGNFDLNGVKLYPGSRIENVNILGGATAANGSDKASDIRISFASPATPATVQAWFRERLAKVGYSVKADGTNLVGTTDENKRFRLDLTSQGTDTAKGTIVIGD